MPAKAGDAAAPKPPARRAPVRPAMPSLWMLVAGLAFALMGVFVKIASAHFATAELVFWRAIVQIAVAYAMLRHAGHAVRTRRLGMHVHRGVAGFVSLFMFFFALTELPVATAMTLNYSSPLFLVILVAALAREKPGAKLIATVFLGFCGVVLLLRPTFAADHWWPGLVGLASGAVSAIAYWNVRELVHAQEPEERVVFYFGVFAFLGSFVWMAPQTWHSPSSGTWWMLAGVGGLGALGQVAMTRAYGRGSTLVAGALSYSGIVFSSIIGIAWFGDLLSWQAWTGIALIVVAGILAVLMSPDRERDAGAQVAND
jgi:drug/metabolite transporter (DMT)-like permease